MNAPVTPLLTSADQTGVDSLSQVEAGDGSWAQSVRLGFRFLSVAVALLALGWAVSNFRQVAPENRAVVVRFGSVARQQGAGLLFAWPRPIEQVVILPAADRQIRLSIGDMGAPPTPTPDAAPGTESAGDFNLAEHARDNGAFLLTGDAGVAHMQATVFYQITDAGAYLVAAEHVKPALARMFMASAVQVFAGRDLDSIMVTRPEQDSTPAGTAARASREQLRSDLVNAVNRRVNGLAAEGASLGISVGRVDVVAAMPAVAKAAFYDVLTASQTSEKGIAQARTEAEMTGQTAQQDRDKILSQAQASALERSTEAKTRTASILAYGTQDGGLPHAALMNRLYYDRIGLILRKFKQVDTVNPKSGMHVLLSGQTQR